MAKMLRTIGLPAFGVIVLIAMGLVFHEFGAQAHSSHQSEDEAAGVIAVPPGVPIGGPFHLTDDKGQAVTDATYRGRWMLVFFGYTNCPDACPLTLQKMTTALSKLGPLADRIAPLFITVDPARDTPARLASYLSNFDPRIMGLTGSNAQIAEAAKAYRVYYSPSEHEQSGADTVSHSTFLYLMDPSGKLNTLFSQDVSVDRLGAVLRVRLSSDQAKPPG